MQIKTLLLRILDGFSQFCGMKVERFRSSVELNPLNCPLSPCPSIRLPEFMEIEQLELDLWRSLSTAIKFPETADFQGLYNALESEIAHQPVREQLQIAAQVLVELAQVYAARVELLLSGWERRYNPAEPVVDLEKCVELFVQSLHLDVAELFEPDEPVNYPENRSSRKTSVADGSLVRQVDKSVMLNALEAIVTESAQTSDDKSA
jgi:hypothetical protein